MRACGFDSHGYKLRFLGLSSWLLADRNCGTLVKKIPGFESRTY
jgi:hypothetical protein